MHTPEEFDEIRPYDPEELPGIFEELIADPEFRAIAEQMLPEMTYEEACEALRQCRTNLDVQKRFFYPLLTKLVEQCSNGLSFDSKAIEGDDFRHTFITNHRDIVLDSAFLSISLLNNGFENTVEIAIGDNLLIKPWIKKLVRVNKSFIVQRNISMRQMLTSSARMSKYMRYAINVKKENIWIAQREGRAKDSNDRTQEAVLKMMVMSGEGNLIERLKNLHLTPTALSYEYDPCDYLKAQEFQQKRDIEGFRKSPADDLENMQTGIFGYKGRIHFQAVPCIDEWLDSLSPEQPKSKLFPLIAQHIDREIHRNYRLYPGNYIAADILSTHAQACQQKNTLGIALDSHTTFAEHYTAEEKLSFENYLKKQLQKVTLEHPDHDFLYERMLIMYAYPVFNQMEAIHA